MKKNKVSIVFQVLSIIVAFYGCYFNSVVTMSLPFTTTMLISFFFSFLGFLFGRHTKVTYNAYIIILFIFSLISLIYTKCFSDSIRFVIVYGVFLFQDLFLIYYVELWKYLKNTILVFALITSFITIISWISNDFYINNILPNIYSKSQNYMYELVVYAKSYPGIFASTGINAFFISIGYFFALVDLIIEEKNNKIWKIILLLIFLLAIILTVKRIVIVCILFISLICFLVTKEKGKISIGRLRIIIFGICLLMCFFVIFEADINVLLNKFDNKDIMNGRGDLYTIAYDKIEKEPLLGYGINSFPTISDTGLSTHNEYLQLIYELGLVQAIIIFILMIYSIFLNFKYVLNVKNKIGNLKNYKIAIYTLCIQLYFIIYCMTGNPFHDFYILYVYVLCLSYFYYIRRELENEKK